LYVTTSSTSSTSNSTSTNALRITGLTSNVANPRVGNSVRFTATAAGGSAPYQYKWWVFDGTTWTMVRDWTTSSSFTWQPTIANANARVGVWLRDSTMRTDVGTFNLSVPSPVAP